MNTADAIKETQAGALPNKVIIKLGECEFRHYSFKVRKGDGHVLTRRGRVQFSYRNSAGQLIFETEAEINLRDKQNARYNEKYGNP